MKDLLNTLFEYRTLDKKTAKEVLRSLTQGAYNNSQVAAFLTVYMMRSITVEELEGFREVILDLCLPIRFPNYDTMDLCGTGGDNKNTFNISTLASFVVAGAGQKVTKHGNNSVSSSCGSSNVLAQLGYKFTNDKKQLKAELDAAGICFLHAPLFHPAMKNVAPIRKELGVRTFFNMLGPMANPSFPNTQLIGVFNLEVARLYGYIYKKLPGKFMILHSLDGYDEISLTDGFKIISNKGEKILYPEELGFKTIEPAQLHSGESVEDAAAIFTSILEGKGTEAQRNVVIANAGMALYCADDTIGVEGGIEKARESLESGKALKALETLIQLNSKEHSN